MRKVLFFIALAFFGIACSNTTPDKSTDNEGKVIYKNYCVACHGIDGELALNGAKKFPESTLSVEERILVITNGRNMMTPFKEVLSEEEIKAVANYTMVLTKKE